MFGLDPRSDASRIKARLGVIPQADNLDFELTVRENLLMYARYFDIPREVAARRADELLQFVQVIAEVVLRTQSPEGDIAADGARDAVELLVGWVDGDDVVTRFQQDVEGQEVGFDGTGGDQDVVWSTVLIRCSQQRPQFQRAWCFGIAEPGVEQALEGVRALFHGEHAEQLGNAHGEDAALGDVELDQTTFASYFKVTVADADGDGLVDDTVLSLKDDSWSVAIQDDAGAHQLIDFHVNIFGA